jgi:uncharacterized protein (DUF433 family)
MAEVEEETNDKGLLDLKNNQYEIEEVARLFIKNIEISNEKMALRWWPLDRDSNIVIDPTRHFGHPIENDSGIPTIILAKAVNAEGSIQKAADWYEVEQQAVANAYKYETEITKRVRIAA